MKKFILAALVLGCVAGVHAEGDDVQDKETRKQALEEVTRGVELAPEDVPEGTRKIEALEQAPTKEA